MKIQTIENRMPELIGVLTQVWEDSVRATHHFLMPGDVERIKEYVPQAIGGIGKLAVAFNEQGPSRGLSGRGGRDDRDAFPGTPRCGAMAWDGP